MKVSVLLIVTVLAEPSVRVAVEAGVVIITLSNVDDAILPELEMAAEDTVPVNVGDADMATLPEPVIEYSPSTPALSNKTRVVVPPETVVVPTVMAAAAGVTHDGNPAATVRTLPLDPMPSLVRRPPELR